jgi:hypothetical protein
LSIKRIDCSAALVGLEVHLVDCLAVTPTYVRMRRTKVTVRRLAALRVAIQGSAISQAGLLILLHFGIQSTTGAGAKMKC